MTPSRGGTISKIIEAAAQRFAIQRDAALAGFITCLLQAGSMFAKRRLDLYWIKPLKNILYCGVNWGASPFQAEGVAELAAIDV